MIAAPNNPWKKAFFLLLVAFLFVLAEDVRLLVAAKQVIRARRQTITVPCPSSLGSLGCPPGDEACIEKEH